MLKRKVAIAALTVALLSGGGKASAQSSSFFDECAALAVSYLLACAFSPSGLQHSGKISQANMAAAALITLVLYNRLLLSRYTNVSSLDAPSQTGMPAQAGGSRWNAWTGYGHNDVANRFPPGASNGDIQVFLGGADYTLTSNTVVGMAVSFDSTTMATPPSGGTFQSGGYSIAPYIAIPFGRNLLFDGSIGFGYADLESQVTIPGALRTAALDRRWFGSASLSYAAPVGKWLFTGKGSYLYAHDDVAPFRSAAGGVFSLGSKTELAQVRIGGQAAYDLGNGFQPYAGVTYINDVQRESQAPIGGFVPANDRDAWNWLAGFNYMSKSGVGAGLSYSVDTGRKETRNKQFLANISIRF